MKTLFVGTISALRGYTVRLEKDEIVRFDYEFQVTTKDGELLFILADRHYEEYRSGVHKPGDYHFYKNATIGTGVKGFFEFWRKRDLNLVLTAHLD